MSVTGSPVIGDDSGARSSQSPPQRRVLIVEDDCLIASLLTEELNEFGYAVVGPAGNLAEAIALASTAVLDGALVDVELGGESALRVAQILSARRVPFLFTTGNGESREGPFHDVRVLAKPYTVKQLQCALQDLLSQ